mmetsp:Transcript_6913/g.10715  ORF Transcript_6913/g.10715 Transcript_6913/m.10715 type:complete len:110 (+) Transcript_6913:1320-1649(+)
MEALDAKLASGEGGGSRESDQKQRDIAVTPSEPPGVRSGVNISCQGKLNWKGKLNRKSKLRFRKTNRHYRNLNLHRNFKPRRIWTFIYPFYINRWRLLLLLLIPELSAR